MKTKLFSAIIAILMVVSAVACDSTVNQGTDGNENVSVQDNGQTQVTVGGAVSEDTTEQIANTAEKTEATTEKAEATTEKTEATTEKTEVTTEKIEVTTEKTEVTTEKIEVTTEKIEVTTEKTEDTTEKNEDASVKVNMLELLKELIDGYYVNPYSFIPENMRPDAKSHVESKENILSDYSSHVKVYSITTKGMGEQWNMVSENLAQSQTFFEVLSVVDTVATTSVVIFENFIDENPEATAQHSFEQGIYTVTIKCDKDNIYYVLDYETELPVLGKQAVQIALSMDLSSKFKTVRAQIGDANALAYTVDGENKYSFAIKYLGVRRAYFEVERKKDGTVEGSIYEYLNVEIGDNVLETSSSAKFYISEEYVTAIGNKADGMVIFDGYVCELYDAKSGDMLAYEVKEILEVEVLGKTVEVEYNTLWFNLWDVSVMSTVKYTPKTDSSEAAFFVNESNDAWEAKLVGIAGGTKAASRRFDIEFRTQYYYYYDAEQEAFVSESFEVPMLFIQEEVYDAFEKDVKSTNGIGLSVDVAEDDLDRLMNDYDELVTVFVEDIERVTSSDIVEIIGERITLG